MFLLKLLAAFILAGWALYLFLGECKEPDRTEFSPTVVGVAVCAFIFLEGAM